MEKQWVVRRRDKRGWWEGRGMEGSGLKSGRVGCIVGLNGPHE
jgi:hypothetical protein